MKLITENLRKTLPPLYSTENEKDPVAQAKFFTPWTDWTWYVLEYDGEDTCFGFVVGLEAEYGYFTISELELVRGPGGIRIERDLYFPPTPISVIRNQHGAGERSPPPSSHRQGRER